jgi:hypothetical protein
MNAVRVNLPAHEVTKNVSITSLENHQPLNPPVRARVPVWISLATIIACVVTVFVPSTIMVNPILMITMMKKKEFPVQKNAVYVSMPALITKRTFL